MADDVMTPSNLSIVLVEDEKFKETSLDVNVSQRPHEEESFRIMVHTQIDHLAWDCQLSFNPHALTIYLNLFFLVKSH